MKTHFWLVMLAAFLCGSGYAQPVHVLRKPQRAGAKSTGKPGSTSPLRRPGWPSTSGKAPGVQNPAAGKRPPATLTGRSRVAAPALSDARHRTPNPAMVAGSAGVSKRNTGAIDGKQVHRRP